MRRHLTRRPRRLVGTALLAAAALVPTALSSATAQAAPTASGPRDSFAVIGDLPYGDEELAQLPGWIRDLNRAQPMFTLHLGDIKSGSQRCDTSYFQTIRAAFDTFRAPLVYTPGDNEWTDCHRENNGGYDPLERLATVRDIFFDRPGVTLGQRPMTVTSQASLGLPENVRFRKDGISFAALHVVGSNNDLKPWDGIGHTTATRLQKAEERYRMAATLQEVQQTFADARARGDRAVVLFQQADMFDPTYTPAPEDISAFTPLVRLIVRESARFDGEVYLLNGDSHLYNADRPVATGSVWLERYGVSGSADNLQRLTVDGSDQAGQDWLRMTVTAPGTTPALTWERVPYSG
ncbi:hypothetical protein [Lapillicoccus jejuensis]|uniref:Calcineurin-like phosphoesterase family protein n=1 Tax=Lapillicoccus jejuensis TaxID=402171 RepID=A0A542E4K3_9MICO|nr:hypothetical protein [Lapillicoccus jejuensis]TQJ10251.1 hypothetical protein FB458_3371 [Lapillicoccus jejuensis]